MEQCNVKLASVASDVLGVSALAMLRALAAGETNPGRMADLAKKQLRKKIPALQLALEGCLLPHHRFLSAQRSACGLKRRLSLAGLRFHDLGCGEFPISVWLGAQGTGMQFTSFPDRCTTGITRHG